MFFPLYPLKKSIGKVIHGFCSIDPISYSRQNHPMTLAALRQAVQTLPNTPKFPVLFVGHGSPMNAVEDNAYIRAWKKIGATLPTPNAILAISAHWLTEGTKVHIAAQPRTIHDFYGFPEALYNIRYDCAGAPVVAEATRETLFPTPVGEDTEWGVDHGTWVVLKHMYPEANIPVFQLSIDVARSHRAHYELAEALKPLREKGVLVIGSGNIVHNLGRIAWDPTVPPYAWADEFDQRAKLLLESGNHDALVDYEKLGDTATLAIPTPEHYWPLLYTLGLKDKTDAVSFPVEGIAHGSISMRAVLFDTPK